MGADAHAYLYCGIRASDIFERKVLKEKFEVHDRKGKPTGTFDFEEKVHLVAMERKFNDLQEAISDKYIHHTDQDDQSLDRIIIGVTIEKIYDEGGGLKEIDTDALLKAQDELSRNVFPKIGIFVPKLYLNLYWSY